MFLRAFGNYDTNKASDESALFCPEEEGMTQQSFKDECDINTIVDRFGLTGELPSTARAPMVGDFSAISDYKSALDAVMAADVRFMEFPAAVRAQFDNDPQLMLDFVADAANKDKAIEIGLVPKPPEVTRDVVTAVDDLAKLLTPKA